MKDRPGHGDSLFKYKDTFPKKYANGLMQFTQLYETAETYHCQMINFAPERKGCSCSDNTMNSPFTFFNRFRSALDASGNRMRVLRVFWQVLLA